MEHKTEQSFEYTYSAPEQAELKRLREKYAQRDPKIDKMEQLRMLDKCAERPGTVRALILGVVGTLLLGIGMCCTMVWAEKAFVPGIVIGLAGIALAVMAYPVYKDVTKKQREKIAPEVLKLIEELEK